MTCRGSLGLQLLLLGVAGAGCEPVPPVPTVDLEPGECDLGTLDVNDAARCVFEISNAAPTPLSIEVEVEPPDGPFALLAEPATFEFEGDESLAVEVVFITTESGAHRSDLLVLAGDELLATAPLKACSGGPCEE